MAFVVAGHAVVMMGGHLVRWSPARERPLGPMMWAWTGAALVSIAAYTPFIPGIIALMGLEETQQAAGVATAGWALGEALRALLAGTGIPAALVGGAFAMLGGLSLLRRAPLLVGLLVMPAIVTGATLVLVGQPLRPRFFFLPLGGRGHLRRTRHRSRGGLVHRSRPHGLGTTRHLVVVLGIVLIALSAVALPTAYRVPKQDFDGAVALLDAAERRGATIAVAGPACLPLERVLPKTWACLETPADWRQVTEGPGSVLVVSTLSDYIEDPELRRLVRDECQTVQRFPPRSAGARSWCVRQRPPRECHRQARDTAMMLTGAGRAGVPNGSLTRMRFCLFTTFYPPFNFGGDGIDVQRTARALVARRHYVTVVHDVDAHQWLSGLRVPPQPRHQDGVEVIGLHSRLGVAASFLTHQLGRPVVHRRALETLVRDRRFDVVVFNNVSLVGGPGLLSLGGRAPGLYGARTLARVPHARVMALQPGAL